MRPTVLSVFAIGMRTRGPVCMPPFPVPQTAHSGEDSNARAVLLQLSICAVTVDIPSPAPIGFDTVRYAIHPSKIRYVTRIVIAVYVVNVQLPAMWTEI